MIHCTSHKITLRRFRNTRPSWPSIPESGRAWYRLGYCELKAALYADAAAHFHKADSLKFNPAYTNYNWACALAQLGDLRTSAIKSSRPD
ncbi:MAG: hypothetical protein IPK53_17625 [bacterium]|nr:hypothetical protein [bacterium]